MRTSRWTLLDMKYFKFEFRSTDHLFTNHYSPSRSLHLATSKFDLAKSYHSGFIRRREQRVTRGRTHWPPITTITCACTFWNQFSPFFVPTGAAAGGRCGPSRGWGFDLISHKVFSSRFVKDNSHTDPSWVLEKNKLTDLWGVWLLQNDFKDTLW